MASFWPSSVPQAVARLPFNKLIPSYRSAIFYTTAVQRVAAERSKQELDEAGRFPAKVVTEVLPAAIFYEAEEYHQDFYQKSPAEYKDDRNSSGRDEFIKRYWGDEYWALFA